MYWWLKVTFQSSSLYYPWAETFKKQAVALYQTTQLPGRKDIISQEQKWCTHSPQTTPSLFLQSKNPGPDGMTWYA